MLMQLGSLVYTTKLEKTYNQQYKQSILHCQCIHKIYYFP
jgi:hypothetical protein